MAERGSRLAGGLEKPKVQERAKRREKPKVRGASQGP